MNLLVFFLLIPILVIQSWIALVLKSLRSLYSFWMGLDFLYKISLALLVFQIYFSIKPWVNYEITFNDRIEFITISSKINLYLFLLEMVHLFVFIFFERYQGLKLLLFSQVVLFLLFNVCLIFPNPIITDIKNVDDYSFTSAIYFFGVLTYANLMIAIRMFIKYDQKVDDLNVTAS
jgi:hypothetical protein